MRWLLLAWLLPTLALADALTAGSAASLAIAAGPQSQLSASMGTRGATLALTENQRLTFGSFDWRTATLEAGLGRRLFRLGRWQGWWSASGFASPVGGWTGGVRGVVGVAGLFVGEHFLLRPGLTASAGLAWGPSQERVATPTPVEASVELGWRGARAIPFLRASAGLASVHSTPRARGELAVGVVMPW